MAVDIHGRGVDVGARVRVLRIDPRITESLPENEIRDIESMLNEVLVVYEADEQFVRVEKTWDRGEGRIESHSLSLSSNEIELVEGAR